MNSSHTFTKPRVGEQFLLHPWKVLIPREHLDLVIILAPLDESLQCQSTSRDLSKHVGTGGEGDFASLGLRLARTSSTCYV